MTQPGQTHKHNDNSQIQKAAWNDIMKQGRQHAKLWRQNNYRYCLSAWGLHSCDDVLDES
jgi:hypothetical protein